ncbi:leucine-rich repeat protein [Ruminococcus flavefaciens]|uniref:leucine-rich repeat protein n=1 Tax=Ruminococcus flavefaciens TaxID=1265 RepID=UPI0026F16FC7|nr:leucine-rich repeat protein [Ruminococcus flavefaciens]MDD7516826.1 leucine-rich repeat protein [Ruminococcus flavefaciens]MDY5692256.1 leucine-rich repeat protein [Ruminococcus flavefaciens]
MAYYTPGNEPEQIKRKIANFLARIDQYYPDKVVSGLHVEHKKLGEKLTAMYRELGYESGQAMLEAYGYEYIQKYRTSSKTDEDKNADKQQLINELKSRLNGKEVYSISDLKRRYPDLEQQITNSRMAKQEFIDAGVLKKRPVEPPKPKVERKTKEPKTKPEKAELKAADLEREMLLGREIRSFAPLIRSSYGVAPAQYLQHRAAYAPQGALGAALSLVKEALNEIREVTISNYVDDKMIGDSTIKKLQSAAADLGYISVRRLLAAYGFTTPTDNGPLTAKIKPSDVNFVPEEKEVDDPLYNDILDFFRHVNVVFSIPDFNGKTFVTTNVDDRDVEWLQKEIEARGGFVRKKISAKTDYLIFKISGRFLTTKMKTALLQSDIGEGKISVIRYKNIIEQLGGSYDDYWESDFFKKYPNYYELSAKKNEAKSVEFLDGYDTDELAGESVSPEEDASFPSITDEAEQETGYEPVSEELSEEIADGAENESMPEDDAAPTEDITPEVVAGSAVSDSPTEDAEQTDELVISMKVLKKCGKNIVDCVVPDGVKSISKEAFKNCEKLKSVVLPSSVRKIGDYAFMNCSNLDSIVLPDGLTAIGIGVFWYCVNLKEITLPNSLESIGKSAFYFCESLRTVKFPANIHKIAEDTFFACNVLNEVIFSKAIEVIEDSAFLECMGLETIAFPSNIKDIGEYAFARCEKLKEISFSEGIENIGKDAFTECNNVERIVFPKSLKIIGENAFDSCQGLKSINISGDDVIIGKSAFSSCEALEDVTISKGIRRIEESAFRFCSKLKRITLPDGLEYIGEDAFACCDALTEISIPGSVKTIEKSAFHLCTELKDIKLGEGITAIGAGWFAECSALRALKLPSSIEHIQEVAFSECRYLDKVYMPLDIKYVAEDAFPEYIDIELYGGEDFSAEIRKIDAEISVIRNNMRLPEENELSQLENKITQLRNEKASLGFFKGKQKKALEEQAVELGRQADALRQCIDNKKPRIEAECNEKIRILSSDAEQLKKQQAEQKRNVERVVGMLRKMNKHFTIIYNGMELYND